MSVSPSATSDETGGRRYVQIRCVVEYVESSHEKGTRGTHSRVEQDAVVRILGHCPFDEIVIVALQKLGYTTRDITGAKGSLQFPNWNSLSCDSITDNLDATVESILGGVASLVTLRIRLHGRPKAVNRDDVKEKLLSFLLQRLQPVLKNSGCPINQMTLDDISNGDLIDLLPSSTQQAFDRWFREQLERPLPSNDAQQTNSGGSSRGNNGFFNGLETSSRGTAVDTYSPGPRNGRSETWTTVDHTKIRLKDEPRDEEASELKDADNDGFRWSGANSSSNGPLGTAEGTDSFKKVPLSHRMRLLPNRNAVYETDALLPATPEQPETEVLVVTPEMPCAETEEPAEAPQLFQTAAPFPPTASFQNEPTDLSMRRVNGNGMHGGEEVGTRPGVASEPPPSTTMPMTTNQSLMLRPFRVLAGQMGGAAEYSTKDCTSRSPSPFLQAPPFMHSTAVAAAAAVSGLQNHLAHLQQQQQHAIQLAAMSRAFNFHFGPGAGGGVHPLKGMTRNDHCVDRATFPYKTVGSLPCTPTAAAAPPPLVPNSLTQLGLQEKAALAAAVARDQKKRSRVFIDPLTEIPKLERWFAEDTHPSSYVIEKFTDELNRSPYRQRFPKLEPKNLQLWFKNHRAKMKRHRDLGPSPQQQQPPSTPGPGFDPSAAGGGRRTPTSPSSFYSDWADRSSTPGSLLLAKMAPGHVTMTSSCSPSSSTGSRGVASSPAAPEMKSASDCSDADDDDEEEEMDVCPDERRGTDD